MAYAKPTRWWARSRRTAGSRASACCRTPSWPHLESLRRRRSRPLHQAVDPDRCRRQEIGGMCWSRSTLSRHVDAAGGQVQKWPRPYAAAAALHARHHPGAAAHGGRDELFGQRANGFTGWSRGKAVLDARSGVKDWTTHDIRRSVATRMADLGIGPHIIEQLLNHRRTQARRRRYLQSKLIRARGARRVGTVGGPHPRAGRGRRAEFYRFSSSGLLMPRPAACISHGSRSIGPLFHQGRKNARGRAHAPLGGCEREHRAGQSLI